MVAASPPAAPVASQQNGTLRVPSADLIDVARKLQVLLLPFSHGQAGAALPGLFQQRFHQPLPVGELGFGRLEDLLAALPHHLRVQQAGSDIRVFAVPVVPQGALSGGKRPLQPNAASFGGKRPSPPQAAAGAVPLIQQVGIAAAPSAPAAAAAASSASSSFVPSSTSSARIQDGGIARWQCLRCTLAENEEADHECRACSEPRPGHPVRPAVAQQPGTHEAVRLRCSMPNCEFFGSDDHMGLCSGCHQRHLESGNRVPGEGTAQWLRRRFGGRLPAADLQQYIVQASTRPELEELILCELEDLCDGKVATLPPAECAVCRDRFPRDQLHEFPDEFRGCGHFICTDCVPNFVQHAVEMGRAECPLCQAEVPQDCLMCLDPQRFQELQAAQLETTIRRSAALGAGQAFVRCPKCRLPAFLAEEDAVRPEGLRAECQGCGHEFCSRCAAPRYHHVLCAGRDCGELMREKEAAWLHWRAEGQARYLQRMIAVDADYADQLRRFQGDQQAQRQALAAFTADENAKRGWRHCPYCNALWAGTDACPQATCGVLEAAMGGTMGQVGCGRRFSFDQARPYVPAALPAMEQLRVPVRPALVVHDGITCQKCTQEIHGLRFRCLHCPHYDLCLRCLAEQGPDHEAENEWPGTGPGGSRHIFDIIAGAAT